MLMIQNTHTLVYDDKTYGRKVIAFPPEMPFLEHLNELLYSVPKGEKRDNLLKIAVIENIFKQADALGEYIAMSNEPHHEILRVAAMATEGELAGLKLLYAALLALAPAETMVTELVEFKNVKRVMRHIAIKEKSGRELTEAEEWFRKKVVLLSMSHPLPGSSIAPDGEPWLGWNDGVRRALSDPDRRWDKAIMERAKAELEALDLRVKRRLAKINFMTKEKSTIFLITKADETCWRLQALEGAYQRYGEATLVIRQKLGDRWKPTIAALRESRAGSAIADLFDMQFAKVHAYPHLKIGTSVVRALLMHPLLLRIQRKPDFLSCLAIYINSAGKGILEILLHKLAAVNILKMLLDLPGFELDQRILTIDLAKVPPTPFIDVDQMPRDVDWTNIHKEQALSYRTLVMTYMDNDNFIVELLNNPRVASQPGIMPLIALRSRSMRILSMVANRRDLYVGFSNKEVPLNLLQNPAKVPVSSLRKFIHVRFIDKATLARLGGKGSQVRDEVRREIQKYLSSINS
jgi:hypothetical protein